MKPILLCALAGLTACSLANPMPHTKIRRAAAIALVVGTLMALLMIGRQGYYTWAVIITDPTALARVYNLTEPTIVIPWFTRFAYFIVTVLPVLIGLYALFQGMLVMTRFRKGVYFDPVITTAMSRCGLALVAVGIASLLARTAVVPLITQYDAPGHRMVTIGLNTHEIGFFLAGLMLWACGWVFTQAIAFKAEAEAFV